MRPMMPAPQPRWLIFAALVALISALGAWLEFRFGWVAVAFDAIAHQFYEVPLVASIRRPSQLALVRTHLTLGSIALVLGLATASWLHKHGRFFLAILGVGYVVRACLWIWGGNLPLVPGDSCHYLEVATSVLRGEGPVKHYVESFFRDYPAIRENRGVLDDWATPLDAYVRAGSFLIAGLGPDSPLNARLATAKACSFLVNLLTLPLLYLFARRRYGCRVAIWTMAAAAILPVHAIYAGFVLRESLVAFMSLLAVWTLTEVINTERKGRAIWAWAIAAGLSAGVAVLSRTTALALLGIAAPFALLAGGKKMIGPLLLWSVIAAAVCLPWAWVTLHEYGAPFYSYTNYFEYNFSWTVHHYEKGNTLPSQFYKSENLAEIVRVKIKSLWQIVIYSTMIVGLPIVVGFCKRIARRTGPGRATDLLVAAIFVGFVLATLKSIADVTQVAQLGRYYLPVFLLVLPAGIAGLIEILDVPGVTRKSVILVAATYCALVWADPTWAYDASWFTKRFQLHWPALVEAGEWMKSHPDQVAPRARVMTWFPWELRVTSDRTTVLMPRNYNPKRIREVINQYGVTHLVWGSFEPPPYFEINPESWSNELERLRTALGLTDSHELYRSSREVFFPVRIYRVQ
jgi:4-amino-4-deoxy-L-arabinose transferase-like glycosyltransferase